MINGKLKAFYQRVKDLVDRNVCNDDLIFQDIISAIETVETTQGEPQGDGYGMYDVRYKTCEFPSVSMGDGSVMVHETSVDGYGFVAVGFKANVEPRRIGFEHVVEASLRDLDSDFLLRFNNSDSIDVVINMLQRAKLQLMEIPND